MGGSPKDIVKDGAPAAQLVVFAHLGQHLSKSCLRACQARPAKSVHGLGYLNTGLLDGGYVHVQKAENVIDPRPLNRDQVFNADAMLDVMLMEQLA